MSGAVKGGLFVGAAVVMGIVAGLVVPSLVVAERETAGGARAGVKPPPAMPSIIGRPLDDAEDELRRRGISHVTEAPSLVEAVAPSVLEVCEAEPQVGQKVRGSARLRAALAGTCDI